MKPIIRKIGGLILPILKADSWELLAEIGRNQFYCNDVPGINGLIYFLKFDNKWISLCAMYSILHLSQILWTQEIEEVVKNMAKIQEDQLIPHHGNS
jgi:hypothetical protein